MKTTGTLLSNSRPDVGEAFDNKSLDFVRKGILHFFFFFFFFFFFSQRFSSLPLETITLTFMTMVVIIIILVHHHPHHHRLLLLVVVVVVVVAIFSFGTVVSENNVVKYVICLLAHDGLSCPLSTQTKSREKGMRKWSSAAKMNRN